MLRFTSPLSSLSGNRDYEVITTVICGFWVSADLSHSYVMSLPQLLQTQCNDMKKSAQTDANTARCICTWDRISICVPNFKWIACFLQKLIVGSHKISKPGHVTQAMPI